MDYILFNTNCLFCLIVLKPPENIPVDFYYYLNKVEVTKQQTLLKIKPEAGLTPLHSFPNKVKQ